MTCSANSSARPFSVGWAARDEHSSWRVSSSVFCAGLGLAAAVHFTVGRRDLTNSVMQATVIALFLFLACLSLFNVALGRRWRWPGIGFALSFVDSSHKILFGP